MGSLRGGSRWGRAPGKIVGKNLKWATNAKLQQVYTSLAKNEEKIEGKNLKGKSMSKFISPSNIENFAVPGGTLPAKKD